MSSPPQANLKWNEANLLENEKIQEEIIRNMREKGQMIDEPKTPYRHGDSDDEDAENVFEQEHFKQRLQDALQERISEWDSDEEEEKSHSPSKSEKEKEEEFKKKRKMHYNEFKVVQRMRQKRKIVEEDEDEDDEEIKKFLANPPNVISK